MGFEAANYRFVPRSGTTAAVNEVLMQFGAVPQGGSGSTFVFRGPDHWIDIQLGVPEPTVSFRLALCNPPIALKVLYDVLTELIETTEGKIEDRQTGRWYEHLNDVAWQNIKDGFEQKQSEFRKHFGTFTAAISADEVFAYISQRDNEGDVAPASKRAT